MRTRAAVFLYAVIRRWHLGCVHVLTSVIVLLGTRQCTYSFELWFSLNIYPGVGLPDQTVFLVF